jgi:hypothetical protein
MLLREHLKRKHKQLVCGKCLIEIPTKDLWINHRNEECRPTGPTDRKDPKEGYTWEQADIIEKRMYRLDTREKLKRIYIALFEHVTEDNFSSLCESTQKASREK